MRENIEPWHAENGILIERIDILENDEEQAWLEKQDFSNSAEDAYTG